MPVAESTSSVRCIYGLPSHELYEETISWLEEDGNRYCVIFEDEEYFLMAAPQHERIRICNGNSDETLKKIAWDFVFLSFEYLKSPGNSTKDLKKMEECFRKMALFQDGIHLVASEFQHQGVDLLQNFLKNRAVLSLAKDGRGLFNCFKGIPAIVCGAGISLEKEGDFLRTLQDKGLIFAGGTALSSLSKLGIRPHFGGVIDPHPPSERYFQHIKEDVPLFFQSRANFSLLEYRKNSPLLWIPGNREGFFEQDSFDGGWNAATFLTALATKMGCNPIILVGVDLVQSKSQTYAGGFNRPEGGELISLGDGLFTRKDWLFAANWFAEFAGKYPEIEWLNASNGLELQGFKKISLSQLAWSFHGNLYEQVAQKILCLDQVDLAHYEKFRASLEKVGNLCDKMLMILEHLFPKPPETSGEHALVEMEIEREIAYEKFLTPIWDVWKNVFIRQMPPGIPPAYGIGLNQWLFIKGICEKARSY